MSEHCGLDMLGAKDEKDSGDLSTAAKVGLGVGLAAASFGLVGLGAWLANARGGTEQWHKTLGVQKGADLATVKSAYRSLARTAHPDVGGNPEEFIKINRAYKQAVERLERKARATRYGQPPSA